MKLKLAVFLVLFLAIGGSAFAQGVIVNPKVVLGTVNGITRPISAATITVCAAATAGLPCSPALAGATFTDAALTQPLSNPFTTDVNGNYQFAIAGGTYTVTETASGFVGYSYQLSVTCSVGVCTVSSLTVTGAATVNGALNANGGLTTTTTVSTGAGTHSGTETFKYLENVRYVDNANGQGWSGVDVGAWINSAYADCPAATSICHIVLANPTPLNFTTPVTFTTKGKYFYLESLFPCLVTSGASFGGCLNYTPTTATNAFTLDVYDTASTNMPIQYGFKNIGLLNNNCTTSGGCGSSAIGIQVGNTNGGIMDSVMDHVSLYGFNTCYQNTNVAATDVHWDSEFFQSCGVANKIGTMQDWRINGKYIGNGQALFAPAGTTPELHWTNPDFVGQTVLPVLDFTSAGGAGNPAHFFAVNGHFENGASSSEDLQYVSGNVDMYFSGGTIGNDSSSGTGSWFISCSGTQVNFSSVEFQSGRPVTQAVLMNSPCRAAGMVGNFSPTNITTFFGGANAANTSVFINIGNTANPQTPWSVESTIRSRLHISDQGTACTNGELALSAGWQSTGAATVTAVAGNGQTCSWTITTGTTTAANPTVTDTLTNVLPTATTVCWMTVNGGTHTPVVGAGTSDAFRQTTLSATVPIFTYQETPTAGGTTYFVTRGCGP
jgi:hypothetical protein